jgi:hypothetical protein
MGYKIKNDLKNEFKVIGTTVGDIDLKSNQVIDFLRVMGSI